MSLDFADLVGLSVMHVSREMQKEREQRKAELKNFYQEKRIKILEDSGNLMGLALAIVRKTSGCYISEDAMNGCSYLPLYALSLVLEKQWWGLSKEQTDLIKSFFQMTSSLYPFSQFEFLNAAKKGKEVGDFRKVISISKSHIGTFWTPFFHALYKSGTKQDLQDFEDYMTSIITDFSILGDLEGTKASDISFEFTSSVDYQMNHIQEISITEVDYLSEIPVQDHLAEMKRLYEELLNGIDALDNLTEEEKNIRLEFPFLPIIADLVMMTKQPKAQKLKMIDDAINHFGISAIMTAEDYIKEIVNDTEMGQMYKEMFSTGSPIGEFWRAIFTIGVHMYGTDEVPMIITNNIFSILIQVENYLNEKYHFLGSERMAMHYIYHILEQLHKEIMEKE